MYITSLFQVLPHGVSLEAIQEVETLPRATVTKEEHFLLQTQQRYSQQVIRTHTYAHLLVCSNHNVSFHDVVTHIRHEKLRLLLWFHKGFQKDLSARRPQACQHADIRITSANTRSNFIPQHPECLFSFSLPNSTHLSITHLSSIFPSISSAFISLVYVCTFTARSLELKPVTLGSQMPSTTSRAKRHQSTFLLSHALFQITVSMAHSRVRSPSPSNKPRYKSYAFTQAAYVRTPEQQRKFLTTQVGCLLFFQFYLFYFYTVV